MKKLAYITDYVEGQPIIASVRYGQIAKILQEQFQLYVISNKKYGSTIFGNHLYRYQTISSSLTQDIKNPRKKTLVEILLRNSIFLKLWRNLQCSKMLFVVFNFSLLKKIKSFFRANSVHYVLATTPGVFCIYICYFIKMVSPRSKIVFEVRDILNHNIGKHNPSYIMKRAEHLLLSISDGLIFLTEGIHNYYENKIPSAIPSIIVTNGFDEDDFRDCTYNQLSLGKKLVFSHIGSIYKNRNLADFLRALILVKKTLKVSIQFNLVGFLDIDARKEIEVIKVDLESNDIDVHVTGTLSHSFALDILKRSDIAVVLTHKYGSDYAIPGKVFEYIGACKPIIAVTEDTYLKELVNHKYGECASHFPQDIFEKIMTIVSAKYDFSDKQKFSREEKTKEIISFIKRLEHENSHSFYPF